MGMTKNITLAIDEDILDRVRIIAAERKTIGFKWPRALTSWKASRGRLTEMRATPGRDVIRDFGRAHR